MFNFFSGYFKFVPGGGDCFSRSFLENFSIRVQNYVGRVIENEDLPGLT